MFRRLFLYKKPASPVQTARLFVFGFGVIIAVIGKPVALTRRFLLHGIEHPGGSGYNPPSDPGRTGHNMSELQVLSGTKRRRKR